MIRFPRFGRCSRRTIALLVLAALGAGGLSACGGSAGSGSSLPKEISPQQAKADQAAGALLLDVREQDEYTQGHIAGSRWIPLGQLSARLAELPRDQLIVTVCRSGARSAQARDLLLAAGYSQVTSMAGGMQAWIAAGFPVERSVPK